ncbi:TonB-dependent receptor domain protein [Pelagibacter phage Skadi-4 EXVC104P]|nr:TonB-dependent receptor domain protein [Pelagibacter phage Skadi-5 EXVC105P]UWJ03805.1 TonB-dependent receptor domain protein [Pelagibacter phage Skadi-6 EXVC106P]UWJ03815.1 TonB-dependent receptor domain protein [Pelagibacter phage Skadi-10 EXVC110P]UWJ03873.1 TonB-dependent receptor domain protein [Pelagibacter phage Skadi-8 EXVC108P]UWJ03946.1 TonB-dependent receptor domain protein [Pelagibacter phage Skadi-3 EXVC103P]UWJ04039.1 TonB-dependent receptor domain protein [Pelagibacter phage 
MANSTQYAKTVAASPSKISTTELHGRVRVAYADFTAAAAQETINMFKLPDGARIIGGRLNHAALGSSTTVSVGHAAYTQADGTAVAADVDEYKAAASSASATGSAVASTTALGENSLVDAPDGLIVTATTAGANATGLITVQMTYVLD